MLALTAVQVETDEESRSTCIELQRRGYSISHVSFKCVQRGKGPVHEASLVFGDIEFVEAALRAKGCLVPGPDDYPISCRPWLRRRIWRGSLKMIPSRTIFVKPSERRKKFTGTLLHGRYDAFLLQGAGMNTPVWFCDVVEWRSEWRVYVCCGRILAMARAPKPEPMLAMVNGEKEPDLDVTEVEACVETYCKNGMAPAGFVADFGVLRDGRTALVEVNDGYAFGLYSTERHVVQAAVNVMIARWRQLGLATNDALERPLDGFAQLESWILCAVCDATGLLAKCPCPLCDGEGILFNGCS